MRFQGVIIPRPNFFGGAIFKRTIFPVLHKLTKKFRAFSLILFKILYQTQTLQILILKNQSMDKLCILYSSAFLYIWQAKLPKLFNNLFLDTILEQLVVMEDISCEGSQVMGQYSKYGNDLTYEKKNQEVRTWFYLCSMYWLQKISKNYTPQSHNFLSWQNPAPNQVVIMVNFIRKIRFYGM